MNSVRFVVDGMLGSLARKLRMFGFDTLYYNGVDDNELLAIASQEDRILLTSDKSLFQRAVNSSINSVLLDASNDLDDMMHVLKSIGVSSIEFLPDKSRCPLCNGSLDIRGKESVNKLIPENVLNMHEVFYFCQQCGKVYWEGSHLKKLQDFGLQVTRRLKNAA